MVQGMAQTGAPLETSLISGAKRSRMNKYYVYTYIDPRNLEEFYYGKGKGSRKSAHVFDVSDSKKAQRIQSIKKAGLEPMIRVIAAGLTEAEALLVEATLIWKLGRFTANIAGGHFAEKFRPHDTYHLELSGFDYRNGIYYYNVGESRHRNWDDYRKYGFISAGQGRKWRDAMLRFEKGDVVAAYLKRRGFVGIGVIIKPAERIRDVEIGGQRLLDIKLACPNMGENAGNSDKSEYVCVVDWLKDVSRTEPKWKSGAELYTTTHIRASLDNQPRTVDFLSREFGIEIRSLVV